MFYFIFYYISLAKKVALGSIITEFWNTIADSSFSSTCCD